MQRSEWRVAKTQVSSRDGVVATMYPQATEAGAEMLKRGGNAIDAAVAAAFTIGVVEPFNSGLGGIAVMAYYEASSGKTYILDGTGPLPMASRPDQFKLTDSGSVTGVYGWPEVANDANNTGYMSPAVPGLPALALEALGRFGKLKRAEVLEAAIHHAEQGYMLDWYIVLGMAVNQHRLGQFAESRRVFYREDGTCYRAPMLGVAGDLFKQPDLGRTLRSIAADGADAFYKGRIAEMIAEDMSRNGGILSYDDLAAFKLRESDVGLRTEYRGHEIIGGLENTGVPTVQEALNILDNFDLGRMEPGSVEELHLMAEAQRLAFLDRFAHLSDADSIAVPIDGIISKSFARARAGEINPDAAAPNATAGDPWAHNGGGAAPNLGQGTTGEGQTTHLTVVDKDRNMVTITSTLGQHFGSAVVAKGTGVLLNNGTMWFDPVPGQVNSIAPGRRVMTAAAPTIVLRDGKPVMAVGAPGGRRVISALIHSISNVVAHGMGPQDALNTPRVHSEGHETVVDVRVGPEKVEALRKLGHNVVVKEETFSTSFFGRPNGITVDAKNGTLLGGVNQYKPAMAIGL